MAWLLSSGQDRYIGALRLEWPVPFFSIPVGFVPIFGSQEARAKTFLEQICQSKVQSLFLRHCSGDINHDSSHRLSLSLSFLNRQLIQNRTFSLQPAMQCRAKWSIKRMTRLHAIGPGHPVQYNQSPAAILRPKPKNLVYLKSVQGIFR